MMVVHHGGWSFGSPLGANRRIPFPPFAWSFTGNQPDHCTSCPLAHFGVMNLGAHITGRAVFQKRLLSLSSSDRRMTAPWVATPRKSFSDTISGGPCRSQLGDRRKVSDDH